MVPGIGWDCFRNWLDFDQLPGSLEERFGYRGTMIDVDGLSGTRNNARQIRDRVLAEAGAPEERELVLIGYSKGAPDILEAIVRYHEIRPRLAAVDARLG